MTNVRLLTASEIRAWQSCRQAWYFRYHEGLVPITPPKAPAFGTLVHSLLARHYGAESTVEPGDAVSIAQARAIVAAYSAHDPVARLQHSVQHVELTFTCRAPTPKGRSRKVTLAGKIDLITTDRYGNTWLWDHKVCSTFPNPTWLRLNIQMRLYLYAAEELGLHPVGIVYNMIRKPHLQQRQGETLEAYEDRLREDILARPDFYFRTELIASGPDLLKEVRDELITYVRTVGKGPITRNPEACRHLGCVYMDLCLQDSPLLRAGFRREEPHSELGEVEIAS